MNGKKFLLGKAPFIRKADLTSQNTSSFMRDVIIALIPLIIFGWVKNGLLPFIDKDTNFWGMIYPLLLPLLGGLFSVLLELLWWGVIVKNKPLKERMATSYAAIPGLLLGMIVSVSTPIWVLFIGTIFATVIAKLIFGGFGHNIFNPALIGFLFIISYSYYGLLLAKTGFGSVGYLNPTEVGTVLSGATPMTAIKSTKFVNIFAGYESILAEHGLLKMFLGLIPGAFGETSALLCILALVYLLVRKVINWRIPVIYIGTVFVLTYIIGAFNGYANTLDFALFGIFNGGLMFGAVFMATEPVTSPRNPNGKVLYALGIGVITVVFRFASKSPEGVAVAILSMNMLTAIIERLAAKLRVEPNKKKVILSYSLIGLLIAGIATFPVVKSIPEPVVIPAYEFVDKSQDYATLDFVYNFKSGDVEFSVTTDQANKIKTISKNEFDTTEAKTALTELINSNKISEYVTSTEEGTDYLIVNVLTKGYSSNVLSKVTYDNDFKITAFEVSYGESYEQGEWSSSSGHPKNVLPGVIIEKQGQVTDADAISGATYTSKAIFRAVGVAKGYVDYLGTITELTLVGKTQDLTTLEFVYTFRNADGKILVTTGTDYTIKSNVDAAILADVEAAIADNKFAEYFKSSTETTIVVITLGYNKKPIESTFTFDSEGAVTAVSITYDQSYDDEYNTEWNAANGRPRDVMPGRIVAGQDDLSNVEVVSGATVTSNAIKKAAQMAIDYLNNLEGTNE